MNFKAHILKLRWLCYKLYVIAVFVITLVVVYPYFWWILKSEKNWQLSFIRQRQWNAVFLWLLGVRVQVEGELPKHQSVVYVANHASYLDTMVMYATISEYFVFLGMAELLQWPLFKVFFTSGMNIAVPRESAQASGVAFQKANEKVVLGQSIAIFPEGGIKPTTPKISGFKKGAFKIAINNKVPIVPIVIKHSNEVLESFKVYGTSGRPGVIKVKVLDPIPTHELNSNDCVPLCAQVRALMIKAHKNL